MRRSWSLVPGRVRLTGSVLVGLLVAAACSLEPTGPAPLPFSGVYRLDTFSSDSFGVVTDYAALGARIDLDLMDDGVAMVDILIPGAALDGGDIREVGTTTWWVITDRLSPSLTITSVWMDTESFVGRWGWLAQADSMIMSQPSCSLHAFLPNIENCRFEATVRRQPN